jgi:hypothetical protein
MGFLDKMLDEFADGVASVVRLPEKIVERVIDDK